MSQIQPSDEVQAGGMADGRKVIRHVEQVTGACSGTGRSTGTSLVRLRCPRLARAACDGWARASGPVPARWVIARIGSSIMTARLGAIMVPAEATDVAGVSIGNRRSALDAKGGCRSTRTTPATVLASACQPGNLPGGTEAVDEGTLPAVGPWTAPGSVTAQSHGRPSRDALCGFGRVSTPVTMSGATSSRPWLIWIGIRSIVFNRRVRPISFCPASPRTRAAKRSRRDSSSARTCLASEAGSRPKAAKMPAGPRRPGQAPIVG